MTEAEQHARADADGKAKSRKTLVQGLGGAVAGAGGMLLMLHFVDDPARDPIGTDHILALGTALVYTLMALFVGFGALLPAVGARMLNVEDEAELRHERRDLLVGALVLLFVAGLLGALGLHGDAGAGILGRDAATIVAAAALIGLVGVSFYKADEDELNRLVAKEAGALTGLALVVLFGGWAALAHLGHVQMFSALAFVAGAFALFLAAIFVVVGRRGMMA